MDSRFVLVFVVAAGILVPGLANYWLGTIGYPVIGSAVWVGGYGAMVLVVWWGWIRPLDLGGAGSGTER